MKKEIISRLHGSFELAANQATDHFADVNKMVDLGVEARRAKSS